MTIPKKGTRIIQVDAVQYRWLVRHKPTYQQLIAESTLSVAVEAVDHPGSTLIHYLSCYRPDSLLSNSTQAITPKYLAQHIRLALHVGWNPQSSGNFELELFDDKYH